MTTPSPAWAGSTALPMATTVIFLGRGGGRVWIPVTAVTIRVRTAGDDSSSGTRTLSGHTTRRVYGGRHSDILFGGGGDDVLWGGRGYDTIYGQTGKNRIRAGPSHDVISDEFGSDRTRIYAGRGDDFLSLTNDRYRDVIDCGHSVGRAPVEQRSRPARLDSRLRGSHRRLRLAGRALARRMRLSRCLSPHPPLFAPRLPPDHQVRESAAGVLRTGAVAEARPPCTLSGHKRAPLQRLRA